MYTVEETKERLKEKMGQYSYLFEMLREEFPNDIVEIPVGEFPEHWHSFTQHANLECRSENNQNLLFHGEIYIVDDFLAMLGGYYEAPEEMTDDIDPSTLYPTEFSIFVYPENMDRLPDV